MDPGYGEQYRTLYEKHWWWRSRNRIVVEEVARLARPGGRILDVGCGPGALWPRLSAFGEVEGVEPDAILVSEEYRERVHVQPFDEHFAPGRSYDLILFLDVLEHLDRPVEALRHAAGLLAPGGLILTTVPAFQLLWTNHDVFNHHRVRYRRDTFTSEIEQAGLEVFRSRYLFHWLFAAKLVVRMKEAVIRPRGTELPSIPPAPLNTALEQLSNAEHAVAAALRLPFGSSFLAVARRPDSAG